MIKAVHHIQITIPVESVEAARRFYVEFLGLKEIDKPMTLRKNGGFWLIVGETQIHIGVEDGVERLKTKAHIGYLVDDISSWRIKFQKNGIELIDGTGIPNCERFEFRDPFGNRVEFIQLIDLPDLQM